MSRDEEMCRSEQAYSGLGLQETALQIVLSERPVQAEDAPLRLLFQDRRRRRMSRDAERYQLEQACFWLDWQGTALKTAALRRLVLEEGA